MGENKLCIITSLHTKRSADYKMSSSQLESLRRDIFASEQVRVRNELLHHFPNSALMAESCQIYLAQHHATEIFHLLLIQLAF